MLRTSTLNSNYAMSVCDRGETRADSSCVVHARISDVWVVAQRRDAEMQPAAVFALRTLAENPCVILHILVPGGTWL